MSTEKSTETFRPRARLLLQLGDQLIRSENVAIIELVKNSYDADATVSEVTFKDIDDQGLGEIVISDNGVGMTPEIVRNVWLEPGADFKEAILEGNQFKLAFAASLPRRTPIGEKGVGRFGAHKLGDFIELVTKNKDSSKEVVITIDWDDFSKETYLDKAAFDVIERPPKLFKDGSTGTRITVRKLKKRWDPKLYQELERNLLSLSSPFQKQEDFRVKSELHLKDKAKQKLWREGLVELDDILGMALWSLKCEVEGDRIVDFRYEFKPWSVLGRSQPTIVTVDDLQTNKLRYRKGLQEVLIDLSKYKIGRLRIEAYAFDLDRKILRLASQNPEPLLDFMAENGGVRVYRDNMRVYDYGVADNDWLSLDKLRINAPAKKIGNRNILGAVMLDRKSSTDLKEKTNREGFVGNEAAEEFREAVRAVIDLFSNYRNMDKDKIDRKEISGDNPVKKPLNQDVEELKETIKDKLKDIDIDDRDKFTSEIFSNLDRIREGYEKQREMLLKSAGAGLSLGVVIHEVDKRIKELDTVVQSDAFDASRVRTLVQGIARLIDSYSLLVAKGRKKQMSAKKLLDEAIFTCDFRFRAHKVAVIKDYSKSDLNIRCSPNVVIGTLLNIFDNSIYWLHTYGVKKKKIFITTKQYPNGEVGIILADNGNGFGIDTEDAIQPFVSTRPGGMGLGLHVVSELLQTQGARLVFRPYSSDELPDEYKDGAIMEFIFEAAE